MNLNWKEIDAESCKLLVGGIFAWNPTNNNAHHLKILDLDFIISDYDVRGCQGFVGGCVLRIFHPSNKGETCMYAYTTENKILNFLKNSILTEYAEEYGDGGACFRTVEEAKEHVEKQLSLIIEIAQGKHQSDLDAILGVVGE